MATRCLAVYLIIALAASLSAQNPIAQFDWIKRSNDSGHALPYAVKALPDGGAIVIGIFNGTLTLGTGESGQSTLVSAGSTPEPSSPRDDLFLARFHADGTLAWLRSAGSPVQEKPFALSLASDETILIAGSTLGAAIFGPGEANQTTIGGQAVETGFVAKYAADGSLLWARGYGDAGSTVRVITLSDTTHGGVILGGSLNGALTYGSGSAAQTINSQQSSNFILCLDPNGEPLWIRRIGITREELPPTISAIKTDALGGAVIGGMFQQSATFGLGEPNQTKLTTLNGDPDAFLIRLAPDGNLIWAKYAVAGQFRQFISAIEFAPDGGILIAGASEAEQPTLFAPGSQQALTYSPPPGFKGPLGFTFLARFLASGTFDWVRSAGNDGGLAISAAADGQIYACGGYLNAVPFDDGAGGAVTLLQDPATTPPGWQFNTYIAKYSAGGRLKALKRLGNPGRLQGSEISALPDSRILLAGTAFTSATLRLASGAAFHLIPMGASDLMLGRIDLLSAVTITTPQGSDVLQGDTLIEVGWTNRITDAGTALRFELENAQGVITTLGYGWSPQESGSALLYLPLMPEGDNYVIRAISTWDSTLFDETDPLTIAGGAVRVNVPNGGEVWAAGTLQFVQWQASLPFAGSGVRLELWAERGKVAELGDSYDPDGEGVAFVSVPQVPAGEDYRVRATSSLNGAYNDLSDAPFTIQSSIPPVQTRSAVVPAGWLMLP